MDANLKLNLIEDLDILCLSLGEQLTSRILPPEGLYLADFGDVVLVVVQLHLI